ncbi:MAG: 50S ribosomal protein L9 [Deltaproteobacteria bacterium]|nr:MAG: 50S ribosomal protein L9 [Deltaproteobacteria bacterium]
MKVILLETVANLGTVGDVVTVKDGYGRNYLIPQGLASLADDKKIKAVEHQRRALEAKRRREIDKAEELGKELDGMELTFARKTSDASHIFGSVTSADIEKAIHEKGYLAVTRRQIVIDQPIKSLGDFDVTVKLHGGVKADIKVTVEEESSED